MSTHSSLSSSSSESHMGTSSASPWTSEGEGFKHAKIAAQYEKWMQLLVDAAPMYELGHFNPADDPMTRETKDKEYAKGYEKATQTIQEAFDKWKIDNASEYKAWQDDWKSPNFIDDTF
ncbi:hypothetical protein C8R44DRAFT_896329 [Mycena epipterygia]|nr:hypothetical protein C8R44DRAFT_896329 [Mycena epipterygia]